ncbi:MAG: NADH:ubiquinone reductase (Na(+)-transporting) subunit C [Bacteroidaceae bacterium]|nr:NADH:ubiquinone reductase (Na(+)-transporting) subunit C [Bacteroidaceae bacterium]
MNTNSNVYTIVYAAVMVIIVAFLLAFVSLALQEIQDNNVKKDVKKQILAALNVEANDATVDNLYDEMIVDKLAKGTELTDYTGDFQTSYFKEIKDGNYHVFVATVNGETKYVFPVYGAGLWGPIWGYVSVNADRNSVFGVSFNHQGETAGLGAEITNKEKFQVQFASKKVLNANGDVALTVTKSGAARGENECDGIAGATLTSNGVRDMLKESLGNYKEFLNAK